VLHSSTAWLDAPANLITVGIKAKKIIKKVEKFLESRTREASSPAPTTMGFKQTIRRLASVRDSSTSRRGRRDSDLDAAAPITGSLPERTSIVEEESIDAVLSAETSLREDGSGQRSYELVLGAEMISPSQPQKPTGKRKPSNAARLRQLKLQEKQQQQQGDGNPRPRRRAKLKDEEPPPQDYLYFGEGGSGQPSPALSSSSGRADTPVIQITPATAVTGVTGRAVSPYRSSPRTSTTSPMSSPGLSVPGSGTTNASKFHSASIVTQNVGYQNLTYGGSLQFDYAQTQAAGTGAGY
jgi:hypothetical protein